MATTQRRTAKITKSASAATLTILRRYDVSKGIMAGATPAARTLLDRLLKNPAVTEAEAEMKANPSSYAQAALEKLQAAPTAPKTVADLLETHNAASDLLRKSANYEDTVIARRVLKATQDSLNDTKGLPPDAAKTLTKLRDQTHNFYASYGGLDKDIFSARSPR